MDFLRQTKLTKEEWTQIEIPIQNQTENLILNMIKDGYYDPSIKRALHMCLRDYLKLGKNHDEEIYVSFLSNKLKKCDKNGILNPVNDIINRPRKKMSGSDKIRMQNSLKLITNDKVLQGKLIDFKIIDEIQKYCKYLHKSNGELNDKRVLLSYINIHFLYKEFNTSVNYVLSRVIDGVLNNGNKIDGMTILKNISKLYEHNNIFDYRTLTLYDHQKSIFERFRVVTDTPKLVFYCAPTSSGKTLTPISLAQEYTVLFVCASKHIGLSLAKSAFNVGTKIGFAFGCESMDDIRLNFNAVVKHKIIQNGKKVPDHSDGTNVRLMLCDLLSFKCAIDYLRQFNSLSRLILFWDEPTIGLDVEDNALHKIISDNWKYNTIPNIILSCATLPKESQISQIIECARDRFPNLLFDYIESVDYFSNIRLYDSYGNVIIPHTQFEDYRKMMDFVEFQGKKYYKFYDCRECCKFLLFLENECWHTFIEDNFSNPSCISVYRIKEVYIEALASIGEENWSRLRKRYIEQNPLSTTECAEVGINITTEHAKTLTNGPTLFISDKVENICKYMLMKASLDKTTLTTIEGKIENNRRLLETLSRLKKDYEDKVDKYRDCDNKMADMRLPPDVMELHKNIEKCQSSLLSLELDGIYKPNTRSHYHKWRQNAEEEYEGSDVYSSYLDDKAIKDIVELYNIKTLYKLMMMMGIGVFSNSIMKETEDKNIQEDNNKYIETMKGLAEQKSLYLIIANSDYIYGTNYQFSHCYLSKDMKNLTQEKIIQCIGRIGRQEKNKHFSFRFRTQEHIDTFYSVVENSIEAENMNRLFG